MADPIVEVPPIVTPFYLDKGIWLAVLTPILLFVSTKLGINLDPATIIGLILPIVAFIVMHKYKTTVLTKQAMVAAAEAVPDAASAAKELSKR